MATVQEFITDTLVLINVIDPGSGPSASESNHALSAANRLLANWSAAGVPVYTMSRDLFVLTGAASYTIGPAGTIATPRPLKIRTASVIAGTVVKKLEIVTADQFGNWADRSRSGKFGRILYYDAAYPLGTIWLMPVPAAASSLELFSVKPLSSFASLAATFDMPPGYEQALQYALAVAIAPSYHGAAKVSDGVTAGALEAKETIARLNADVLGAPGAHAEAVTTEA